MATYYKFIKSEIIPDESVTLVNVGQEIYFLPSDSSSMRVWISGTKPPYAGTMKYYFPLEQCIVKKYSSTGLDNMTFEILPGQYFYEYPIVDSSAAVETDTYYIFQNQTEERITVKVKTSESSGQYKTKVVFLRGNEEISIRKIEGTWRAGNTVETLYSLKANAYPYNGANPDDGYFYSRTTVTSPTNPSKIIAPNPITTSNVTVSWSAAKSNTNYPVNLYEVSYSTDGGSDWRVAGTTASTSLIVNIPVGITSIQFRVRAQDSNGQWSSYAMGTASTVLLSPTLTVPSMAMQGQSIPVSWTAVDGATGYTLQRKANTDADWVEVYTGQDLEFTEEVGTWSTVQYRVQATFSSGLGGWGTSKVIPVVSASALVISGQDGYLGTLTADVPYTVSTDTGKPITVERKVNGQVVASIKASSNFAYDIPIYDLPTGAGTITLTCSVTPEGQAPVQAERKWTYYKAPVLFPQTGSTAQITKEGKNIYPLTIAEAVRTPQYMGGSLDKTLELLEEILNTAVISVGTYVGTGTSGQSAPNRLRFMSPPTVVTVYGEGRVLSISNTEPTGGQADAYIQGNEAIWYNISADKQLNESGKTYTYFAAGKRV